MRAETSKWQTATSSGLIKISTKNGGTAGTSGYLQFSSGTTTCGGSGEIKIGTGTAAVGKGG